MKIHYLYSPTYPITACGLYAHSNFMRSTVSMSWSDRTTWMTTCDLAEVTCKSCMRCMDGYRQRIQAIVDKYADIPLGKLIAMLLDNYQFNDDECYYYGGEEAQELYTALAFRLMKAGLISSLRELDIEYWGR